MIRAETAKRLADRIRRFQQTEMTVAQFCSAEGVSQPSFYNWRRKLKLPSGNSPCDSTRLADTDAS
ncbi:IS66 family insertion sequence element accessory protein TnpA [Neorhodopirellula lusitana]|uniref:IS66 family insertion sequence element accessory protein TnpA n=1 Tax=Neorhodopirellula lusitana TaxID=445327 RepID=UPI0024B7D003|nr:hypothetical protein [Neorhodopirellula lusitana]